MTLAPALGEKNTRCRSDNLRRASRTGPRPTSYLDAILRDGDQNDILDKMQHRKDLYELLRYEEYNSFDQSLFNFEVHDTPQT